MKTESIIRILDSIYGKIDSFSSEELLGIDTLSISRFGFDGSILEVDFNDLLNFSNLESLTIDSCILDVSVVKIIASLSNLDKLYIYNCEINEDVYEEFNNIHVKELGLCNVDINVSRLNGIYQRLQLENVKLEKLNCKVTILDVFACEITDVDELLGDEFEIVVISTLQYLSNQLKFDDCGRKVIVMEDNGQFVSQKVGFDGEV